jgi:hypothetical protein
LTIHPDLFENTPLAKEKNEIALANFNEIITSAKENNLNAKVLSFEFYIRNADGRGHDGGDGEGDKNAEAKLDKVNHTMMVPSINQHDGGLPDTTFSRNKDTTPQSSHEKMKKLKIGRKKKQSNIFDELPSTSLPVATATTNHHQLLLNIIKLFAKVNLHVDPEAKDRFEFLYQFSATNPSSSQYQSSQNATNFANFQKMHPSPQSPEWGNNLHVQPSYNDEYFNPSHENPVDDKHTNLTGFYGFKGKFVDKDDTGSSPDYLIHVTNPRYRIKPVEFPPDLTLIEFIGLTRHYARTTALAQKVHPRSKILESQLRHRGFKLTYQRHGHPIDHDTGNDGHVQGLGTFVEMLRWYHPDYTSDGQFEENMGHLAQTTEDLIRQSEKMESKKKKGRFARVTEEGLFEDDDDDGGGDDNGVYNRGEFGSKDMKFKKEREMEEKLKKSSNKKSPYDSYFPGEDNEDDGKNERVERPSDVKGSYTPVSDDDDDDNDDDNGHNNSRKKRDKSSTNTIHTSPKGQNYSETDFNSPEHEAMRKWTRQKKNSKNSDMTQIAPETDLTPRQKENKKWNSLTPEEQDAQYAKFVKTLKEMRELEHSQQKYRQGEGWVPPDDHKHPLYRQIYEFERSFDPKGAQNSKAFDMDNLIYDEDVDLVTGEVHRYNPFIRRRRGKFKTPFDIMMAEMKRVEYVMMNFEGYKNYKIFDQSVDPMLGLPSRSGKGNVLLGGAAQVKMIGFEPLAHMPNSRQNLEKRLKEEKLDKMLPKERKLFKKRVIEYNEYVAQIEGKCENGQVNSDMVGLDVIDQTVGLGGVVNVADGSPHDEKLLPNNDHNEANKNDEPRIKADTHEEAIQEDLSNSQISIKIDAPFTDTAITDQKSAKVAVLPPINNVNIIGMSFQSGLFFQTHNETQNYKKEKETGNVVKNYNDTVQSIVHGYPTLPQYAPLTKSVSSSNTTTKATQNDEKAEHETKQNSATQSSGKLPQPPSPTSSSSTSQSLTKLPPGPHLYADNSPLHVVQSRRSPLPNLGMQLNYTGHMMYQEIVLDNEDNITEELYNAVRYPNRPHTGPTVTLQEAVDMTMTPEEKRSGGGFLGVDFEAAGRKEEERRKRDMIKHNVKNNSYFKNIQKKLMQNDVDIDGNLLYPHLNFDGKKNNFEFDQDGNITNFDLFNRDNSPLLTDHTYVFCEDSTTVHVDSRGRIVLPLYYPDPTNFGPDDQTGGSNSLHEFDQKGGKNIKFDQKHKKAPKGKRYANADDWGRALRIVEPGDYFKKKEQAGEVVEIEKVGDKIADEKEPKMSKTQIAPISQFKDLYAESQYISAQSTIDLESLEEFLFNHTKIYHVYAEEGIDLNLFKKFKQNLEQNYHILAPVVDRLYKHHGNKKLLTFRVHNHEYCRVNSVINDSFDAEGANSGDHGEFKSKFTDYTTNTTTMGTNTTGSPGEGHDDEDKNAPENKNKDKNKNKPKSDLNQDISAEWDYTVVRKRWDELIDEFGPDSERIGAIAVDSKLYKAELDGEINQAEKEQIMNKIIYQNTYYYERNNQNNKITINKTISPNNQIWSDPDLGIVYVPYNVNIQQLARFLDTYGYIATEQSLQFKNFNHLYEEKLTKIKKALKLKRCTRDPGVNAEAMVDCLQRLYDSRFVYQKAFDGVSLRIGFKYGYTQDGWMVIPFNFM